jgi:hypothetical protein
VKICEVFGSVWKDHADDHLIPFVCIKWWSECSDCSRMMLHFFPCSDVVTIDWIRYSKLSQKRYAYAYIYRSSLFKGPSVPSVPIYVARTHTNHFRLTATRKWVSIFPKDARMCFNL